MNRDDLFRQLPTVGCRPGSYKMRQDLWLKMKDMNREEKMRTEDYRFPAILYFKSRHDRMVYKSSWNGADVDYFNDRADLYKRLCKELLGLYANQHVVNKEVGLSLTYVPRDNEGTVKGPIERLRAGTLDPEGTGKLYLPSSAGGKGEFVEPYIYFQQRPVNVLVAKWIAKSRHHDLERSELIHTEFCDNLIKEIEERFNITFPYEIRSKLTVNSFVRRSRK